ncbi:MAG TPA: hypothetical protein VEC01_11825 [Noviherbaspirillum sp.]|uniref:hypothetical protein n=1 Tax=Noviherbaspirillum sp. TaxID=1926288 RepID=UPI002D6F49BA|nr:hypothetical protein [Noviherbaspirillum sp.]HYD96007.1 hypothetical protein [Noviherbaspirillum sp.]
MENFEYKLLVCTGLVLAAVGYVLLFSAPTWIGAVTLGVGGLVALSGAVGAMWNA